MNLGVQTCGCHSRSLIQVRLALNDIVTHSIEVGMCPGMIFAINVEDLIAKHDGFCAIFPLDVASIALTYVAIPVWRTAARTLVDN